MYEPLDASKLTREEKHDALESLLFITEKKDGRIKSRKCAMGNKQRTFDGYEKAAGSCCWPESKYDAVSGPQWKWKSGASRFPHVAKALV